MANLVLAFAELLGGAVILDAAIKGDSITNVIRGAATQHPLTSGASSSSSTATTSGGAIAAPTGQATAAQVNQATGAGGNASQILSKIPSGTFASNVTTAGIQARVLAAVLWAKTHGWAGQVISGFRTFAQQTAIYNSGVRPAAVPGTSNHEKGLAVDVTDPTGFAAALAGAPASIMLHSGASYGDPGHFSPSGG